LSGDQYGAPHEKAPGSNPIQLFTAVVYEEFVPRVGSTITCKH